MSAPKRPAMRYHGGKWRLAPWVISHFPAHRIYVEPFSGAASVLLRKERAFSEIINDVDDEIVNLFRVLRGPSSAAELQRLCELTPYSRSEFNAAYESTDDPIERARRILVRSWMGHGSSGVRRHRTGLRVCSYRQRTTPAHDWHGWPAAIAAITARLRGVVIECRPAAQVIARHDSPATLFYLDPPYPFGVRSQKRKGNALYHGYRHEMSDDAHVELLDQVARLSGMVALSSYDCALYSERLRGWQRREKIAKADRAGERLEILWLNPAAARALGAAPLAEAAE